MTRVTATTSPETRPAPRRIRSRVCRRLRCGQRTRVDDANGVTERYPYDPAPARRWFGG